MASAGFFALRFLAAVGVAVIAYWPLMKVAGWASSKLASWIDTGNLPYYHGRLLWMFPAWFLCVLVLYLAVFPFLGGANPWRLFVAGLGWSDLVRGVLLGIGEASAAMLVAVYALRLAQPLRRRQVGADAALEYRILGQTGWMRSYKSLFEIIPFPWSYLVVVLPLIAEELLFRGLMVPLFLPYGVWVAVVASTVVFMGAQVARLPSWYQGLAPVCGAAIMGLANAYLFTLKPNLTPLSLAHAVFLGFFLGSSSPSSKSAG